MTRGGLGRRVFFWEWFRPQLQMWIPACAGMTIRVPSMFGGLEVKVLFTA
jgi:hypothetical protein